MLSALRQRPGATSAPSFHAWFEKIASVVRAAFRPSPATVAAPETSLVGTLIEAGILQPGDRRAFTHAAGSLLNAQDALRLAAGKRSPLGELLRSAGRISAGQLEAALRDQRRLGERIGNVLVGKGWLTPAERQVVLAFQHYQSGQLAPSGRLRLGELLVAEGTVSGAQLQVALQRQARSGKPVGAELVASGAVGRSMLDAALAMQKRLVAGALAAALALGGGFPALARASDTIEGTAIRHGEPSVSLRVTHRAAHLEITSEDVRRGTASVHGVLFVVERNGFGNTCVLSFRPCSDMFTTVTIDGLGHSVEIGPGGGTFVHRPSNPSAELAIAELQYRFVLAPSTRPGIYPWPMTISARSL